MHAGVSIAPVNATGATASTGALPAPVGNEAIVLLSIGRFDPRKNLPLALQALAALRVRTAPDLFSRVRLVFAGHLNDRWPAARDVRAALEQRARAWNLEDHVTFIESPTAAEQAGWLERALVVVHTPEAEHLGLVPLEAMAAGRPVIAVNRGSPLETVVVGRTGLLSEPTPDGFAAGIVRFIGEPDLARRMGDAGRIHVQERFSRERFGDRLDAFVRQLAGRARER
jgi:alpha-1,3/alpha-1,6-mannosyltransferase